VALHAILVGSYASSASCPKYGVSSGSRRSSSPVTPARRNASIWWSEFCSAVETRAYPSSMQSKIPDRQWVGYSS
jgi:GNAT superfamily N-acetyltransferase